MRNILIILFLLVSIAGFSQPTLFGSASNPADNGNTAGATVLAVTPPGSMITGDLVLMFAHNRDDAAATTSVTVSTTGGQTWSQIPQFGGSGAITVNVFYCKYNGTWAANPAVTFSTTSNVHSVVMHVFRVSDPKNQWAYGGVTTVTSYSVAGSTPATITGLTTSFKSSVVIGAWYSNNVRTWTNLAGSGWAVAGSAQYRNLAGSDQTSAYAYAVVNPAGASGDVSKDPNTTTNGTDAILYFYEFSSEPFKIIDN